jgi:hypothetical protein
MRKPVSCYFKAVFVFMEIVTEGCLYRKANLKS